MKHSLQTVTLHDGGPTRQGSITLFIILFLAVISGFITALGAEAPASRPTLPPMKILLDLAYADIPGFDPRLTSLDLYAPPDPGGLPVVVFVHGGGWWAGDKRDVAALPALFTSAGYLFASINYRLPPNIKYPANVEDVADALARVEENIAQYGGNPAQVFLMGYSAGAHLAALAAMDERKLKAYGKDLSLLKGVVLLDLSVYDIEEMMRTTQRTEELHGPFFGMDPAVWRDATPLTHVTSGKKIPPVLLIYVSVFRREQAEALARAIRETGGRAEAMAAGRKTHQTVLTDLGKPGDLPTEAIMTFLAALR